MRVEPSPFDSRHYGIEVGRLVRESTDDAGALAMAMARARADGYLLVFLRLAADDVLRGTVEAGGLRPVDLLVTSTLDRARPAPATRTTDVEICRHDRLEREDDIAAVIAITSSLQRSHLHADARLPSARTAALYAEWARNDVTGRARHTILARHRGDIVGYITLLDNSSIALDLVAVRADLLGHGVGSAMLAAVRQLVDTRDVAVTVGTQVDNPALRLYARFGFVPTATHATYHLWLDRNG